MSTVNIDTRFRVRRRTAASWTSLNEVLLDSEIGLESDTAWPNGGGRKFKIGDGVTAWNSLPYAVPSPAPSVQSVTSAATVTPTFSDDMVKITAQAVSLALANPTGTAIPGWGIVLRIKDNGTSRAISFDTQYRAIGISLPTATAANKTLYLGMIYNADDTMWDVVSKALQA